MENINKKYWNVCSCCKGQGKKRNRLRKKVKLQYQQALELYQNSKSKGIPPTRPKAHLAICNACKGSGLIQTNTAPKININNYPNIAIIGGGIGGMALGVACLHRGIPFTIYERDESFDARSQGYGLTLQQASKAMEGFGIFNLEEGIVSTRHVVHNTNGDILGEWGIRKWGNSKENKAPKKTNIHIARQSLRLALLKQLEEYDVIKWGHQLLSYDYIDNDTVSLKFKTGNEYINSKANLVVGADGIRSTVRNMYIGENETPLRYLNCIVILGICPLNKLTNIKSDLLDNATVFQTANGIERIYMMPYDKNNIMWQLSYPMDENDAKNLSGQGKTALKKEACLRTQWHTPIPEILKNTPEYLISGYPVYDRALLSTDLLQKDKNITLIGDAAHPMSPFKGQGANQALLDALSLAKEVTKGCSALSGWKTSDIKKQVLTSFEDEMLTRSATKVKDSAEAAQFLHSDVVLNKANEPRGRFLKRNNT